MFAPSAHPFAVQLQQDMEWRVTFADADELAEAWYLRSSGRRPGPTSLALSPPRAGAILTRRLPSLTAIFLAFTQVSAAALYPRSAASSPTRGSHAFLAMVGGAAYTTCPI